MGLVADTILAVRDSLTDPNGDRHSDARLLRLLNEGQKVIARHARVLREVAAIPLRASVAEYDMPTDCYAITRAIHSENGKLTLRTRAWMDEYNPKWEIETGADPEYLVTDKLKPRRIRIYPIPTATDGVEFDSIVSDFGVVTSSTGDSFTSDFGIVSEITESAVNTTNMSGDFGVLVSQSEVAAQVLVHYIRTPPTVFDINTEDADFALDETHVKALKHYIVGMALRDDKDTQNRQVGNEELGFFEVEMREFKKLTGKDNTQQSENQTYYDGGGFRSW